MAPMDSTSKKQLKALIALIVDMEKEEKYLDKLQKELAQRVHVGLATENDANPLFRLLAKYITPIKGDPDQ
jgi:hypothetical protein